MGHVPFNQFGLCMEPIQNHQSSNISEKRQITKPLWTYKLLLWKTEFPTFQTLWVFACNVPGACLFGNDRGEWVRDLSKRRRKRGNGHSSIRGWRKSKWGTCFQQLVSSLRCRACWLHCPQFMRRRGVHTRVHTPVRSCQSRQRSPPNSTQFTGTVSFSSSI